MGVEDVVNRQVNKSIDDLAKAGEGLKRAVGEYVRDLSVIRGVVGVYFGLHGIDVNLLVVHNNQDSDIGFRLEEGDDEFYDVEDIFRGKYSLGIVDVRYLPSNGRSLDELEADNSVFSAFIDDNYSGKPVERVYPLE